MNKKRKRLLLTRHVKDKAMLKLILLSVYDQLERMRAEIYLRNRRDT